MGNDLFIPSDDKEILLAEGLRLVQTGEPVTSLIALYREAVQVLPEERRRIPASVSKVAWFRDAMAAAIDGQPVPKLPTEEGPPRARIVWTALERQRLCERAAELMHKRKDMTAREALFHAQGSILPSNRQRLIRTKTEVADWYPAGLEACSEALRARIERDRLNKALAKTEAAIQATQQAEAVPDVGTAPEPREPVVVEPEPVRAPEPTTTAHAMATALTSQWAGFRERLVHEVASIVTEGIELALKGLSLGPSQPVAPGVPVEAVRLPKAPPGPPRQSVLVVGLKNEQVGDLQGSFGKLLDLRFCTPDQSKDQLRSMAEAADVTVAMTNFLSHSHTDIIKGRSKNFIQHSGGITGLKSHLARLAGVGAITMNGHAA